MISLSSRINNPDVWAGVCVFLAFLCSFLWFPGRQLDMAALTIGLCFLGLVLFPPERLGLIFRFQKTLFSTAIGVLLALTLWFVVRSITSDIPAHSLAQMGGYLLPFCTALSIAIIQNTKTLDHVIGALYAFILVLCGMTVLSAVLPWPLVPLSSIGRTQWPFEDANHLAMMMNAGFLMSLAFVFRCPQKRFMFTVLAGFFLLGLLTTGSRGGFLSAVIGCTAFFVLKRPSFSLYQVGGVTAGLIGLLFLSFFLTPGRLMAITGFQDLLTGLTHALESRPLLWASTIELIASRPLAGFGVGTFPLVFAQKIRPEHLTSAYSPHNDFLQLFLETGLIGAGLYLFFGAVLFYGAFRYRHDPLVWTSAPVLAALFIHAQIEFMLSVLPVLILSGVMIGLVLRAMMPVFTSPSLKPLFLSRTGWVFALVMVLCGLTSTSQIYAQIALRKSEESLMRKDIPGFLNNLKTTQFFSIDLHAGPHARAADFHLILFLSGDHESDLTRIQKAVDSAQKRNPYSPVIYHLQGRLDHLAGRSPLPAWEKGLRLDPRSAGLRLALLRYHQELGHEADILTLVRETRKWRMDALKGPVAELDFAMAPYKTP